MENIYRSYLSGKNSMSFVTCSRKKVHEDRDKHTLFVIFILQKHNVLFWL